MDKTPQDVILSGFLPSLVHRSRPTYISSSIIRSHSISVCHMIISLPIESWEAIINAVHSSHISPFVWLQQHSLGVSIIFYNGFLNRRRVFLRDVISIRCFFLSRCISFTPVWVYLLFERSEGVYITITWYRELLNVLILTFSLAVYFQPHRTAVFSSHEINFDILDTSVLVDSQLLLVSVWISY